MLRLYNDGVCGYATPRIMEYSLEAIDPPSCGETLIVLDYGLPYNVLKKLKRPGQRLIIIDHHRVPPPRPEDYDPDAVYCNPVSLGIGGEDDWPATSLLLYKITGRFPDLALVGVMGDRPDAKTNLRDLVNTLSAASGVYPEEAEQAARMLDSCYRRLDYSCIRRGVELLAARGVRGIISDKVFKKSLEEVEGELTKIMEAVRKGCRRLWGGLLYCEADLENPIHTLIGRELAKQNSEYIVVLVASIKKLNDTIIYVRSAKRRPGRLLHAIRGIVESECPGASIGGKERVFAIEKLRGCRVDRVVSRLLRLLAEEA